MGVNLSSQYIALILKLSVMREIQSFQSDNNASLLSTFKKCFTFEFLDL